MHMHIITLIATAQPPCTCAVMMVIMRGPMASAGRCPVNLGGIRPCRALIRRKFGSNCSTGVKFHFTKKLGESVTITQSGMNGYRTPEQLERLGCGGEC